MTDPDEDPLVPYQDSDAEPGTRRGDWRWLIITVVVLLVLCGGMAVAANAWLGRNAEKVRDSVASVSAGEAPFRGNCRTPGVEWPA